MFIIILIRCILIHNIILISYFLTFVSCLFYTYYIVVGVVIYLLQPSSSVFPGLLVLEVNFLVKLYWFVT